MVLPDFQRLAAALSALLGQPAPALAPDAFGLVGFTVRLEGTVFSLVQSSPGAPPPAVHLLATFGAVPEGREAAACQALLEANFTLIGVNAPAFCRHPGSGEIVLRASRPLQAATAESLLRALQALAEVARGWRESLLAPGMALVVPPGAERA